MPLPSSPPPRSEATLPVRRGSTGWPVYALQCALVDALGYGLVKDGAFGPATDLALRQAQRSMDLAADGVAGPKTWAALAEPVCFRVYRIVPQVPLRVVKGFFRGEGGNHGAAVNWSVAGGVDCGGFQHRVYGPPYDRDALKRAFSPVTAGVSSMAVLRDRAKTFATVHPRSPFSPLELAVLAHNFPWAADQYFRYGRLPNPSKPAPWVPASLPASAKTYDGWCRFYVASILRVA